MNPKLVYVALSTANPARLSEFLGDALGLPSETRPHADGDLEFFSLGQSQICVVERGHSFLDRPNTTGLDHIAIDAGATDLATLPLSFSTSPLVPQTVMSTWQEVRLKRAATAGVTLRLCSGFSSVADVTTTWLERIDHIGIASSACDRQEHVFQHTLGCPIESRQTDYETRLNVENFVSDRHGVVQHPRPAQLIGGLRVAFLTVGDCELEILAELPTEAPRSIDPNAAGDTSQDRSAIGRFVERRGEGLHHLALKTYDINALLDRLQQRDWRVIDRVGRPGSRRALIGFIHPSELGGVLIHFVERNDQARAI